MTVPNGYRRQENLSRAPPSAQAGHHKIQHPIKVTHLRSLTAAGSHRQPKVFKIFKLRADSSKLNATCYCTTVEASTATPGPMVLDTVTLRT
jgi:hypothetical protein